MSDGSKAERLCVAVLIGGLLSPTTENNLTPSLNNGDDHLTGKWAFASKLDTADVVKHGKIMLKLAEKDAALKVDIASISNGKT